MSTVPDHSIDLTEERAFERIFRTYYNPLVLFALKYVNREEVAEDLVQEMFSNLWIKAGTIRIRTSLKSYLYGAVRNACLNYLKHEKVKKTYAGHFWNVAADLPETDFLELDELEEKIGRAFDKIPAKCREIFEMSRYEGKKYREIAEVLNLSVKTVENQMGKALRILREELKDYLILILWIVLHRGIF